MVQTWEIVAYSLFGAGLLIAGILITIKFTSDDDEKKQKVFEEDIKWQVEDYENDPPPEPIFRNDDNKDCQDMITELYETALGYFNYKLQKEEALTDAYNSLLSKQR